MTPGNSKSDFLSKELFYNLVQCEALSFDVREISKDIFIYKYTTLFHSHWIENPYMPLQVAPTSDQNPKSLKIDEQQAVQYWEYLWKSNEPLSRDRFHSIMKKII